jgi:hypothetical protein
MVNVSQLTFSTHEVSMLTFPPTIGGEPCCQVADGPPGLGPTVPVEGVGVAKMSTNAIVQSRPRPEMKKNAPTAARPELRCEEVFFMVEFSFNLSFGSSSISGRKPHTNTFLYKVRHAFGLQRCSNYGARRSDRTNKASHLTVPRRRFLVCALITSSLLLYGCDTVQASSLAE